MDIRFLKTLRTIKDTGSFQSAANKLGYTQSTVTFQIQQLEREFSIKLFEKIGRKMVLTQAGEDILPHIDSIMRSMQYIENYATSSKELKGELKIAMPESLLVYRMQPVLKFFRQQAPDVNISLQSYNCYTVSNMIINGEIDIGMHYDIKNYSDNIIKQTLDTFPLTLVASANTPDNKGYIAEDFTLIVSNDPKSVFRSAINKNLRNIKLKARNVIELGSFEAIKKSVINNLGIAYLPHFAVEEELHQGVLKQIHIEGMDAEYKKAVYVYHKNKWLSPSMELFTKLVKQHAQQSVTTKIVN